MKIVAFTFVILLAVLISANVTASTGAFEINQACVESGCFPGDQPGYPISITSPGKYVLTSNIHIEDPDTHAILVDTDNVRIDLNGLSISGPNQCDIETGECSPAGGGRGIALVGGDSRRGVHIVNGQIDGFGNYCMSIGVSGYASDLTLSNCFAGTGAGRGAVVERVRAYNNRYGIDLISEAIVRDSTSIDNIQNGIQVNSSGRRVIIENNLVMRNGGLGIQALGPALISNNFISENSVGIYFSGDSSGSNVHTNVVHKNSQHGVRIVSLNETGGIGFSGNTLNSNGDEPFINQISADDFSRVFELSPNLCHNTTTCTE